MLLIIEEFDGTWEEQSKRCTYSSDNHQKNCSGPKAKSACGMMAASHIL